MTAPPTVGRVLGSWTLEPAAAVILAAAAALYVLAAVRARWSSARTASFLAGIAVIACALMSGVDAYADDLLSIHMAQHMLLLMGAPVLLLYGAPVRLTLAAAGRRGRGWTGRLLHHPLVRAASTPAVGVTLLAGVLLGTHFTPLFGLALRHEAVHQLEHVAYLAAGIACFAPLIAADPLPRPPGSLARLAWLMIVMSAMTAVGAVLTSDTTVRYREYLAPARALHVSAIGDEHLAGVVMWVGGGLAGGALMLAVVVSTMVAEERRQQRRDLYAREVAP